MFIKTHILYEEELEGSENNPTGAAKSDATEKVIVAKSLAEFDELDEKTDEELEKIRNEQPDPVDDPSNEDGEGDDGEDGEIEGEGGEDGEGNEDDIEEAAFAGSVLSDAQTITGVDLNVDFGDTDPDTPEGVAKYLKSHEEYVVSSFEEELKKRAPNAYRALSIELEGGDPSEYFRSSSNVPTNIEIKEDDIATHKLIISEDLKLSGFSEDHIKIIVSSYEDNETTFEAAKNSQKSIDTRQEDARANYEKEVAKSRAEENEVKSAMVTTIVDTINKGIVGDFRVPQADMEKLSDAVISNVQYVNGKFMLVKEVNSDNLNDLLATEFFSLKGADLSKFVTSKAKSLQVKKLKKTLKSDSKTIENKNTKSKSTKAPIRFADL